MKKIIPALLLPLLVPGVFLILSRINNPYILFPENENYEITAYQDQSHQGRSRINRFQNLKDKLQLQYTLDSTYNSPFAGVTLESYLRHMDLSAYDLLKLRVKSSTPRFRINLKFFLSGFTNSNFQTSEIFTEYWQTAAPYIKEYTIPLNQFRIPKWWYDLNKSHFSFDEEIDFHYFRGIDIGANDMATIGIPQEITIEEISFYKDFSFYYKLWLQCALVYYAILGTSLFWRWRYNKDLKKVIILSTSPGNGGSGDKDFDKLMDCINSHFTKPEISLEFLNKHTGFSPKKINRLMNTHLKLSFRKYLNHLRIEEGKRALRDSNETVSEISYRLGYNNPTHFHRIFKQHENLTPNEYRSAQWGKASTGE